MGHRRVSEKRVRTWENILVFSCQEEMRKIIETVGSTYGDYEMPFNNFCYPGGGGAERVEATLKLVIKLVPSGNSHPSNNHLTELDELIA
jgi:hypothetical protein